ncbi:MAG: hypothetical protein COC14_01370 [Burkholderiaceae bacterium]|jgi:hypothetical protein|uniref:Uncharacterized protein n=1 Tax=Cupriavidus metallidurans TaxID=119219 RepID=A0A482IND0_9BURK|nr:MULTISPECIES: hypothetical protein [Cupriavidus]KWR79727.1 hypothetical protein RN01_20440 [Cupriavidus sp. SHE]PCH58498.1 MAG: hypothetical protein COC14_01370 [Burkholderiaceae bacterium]QBP09033.1 hypothetical protein DDF84_004310 [Cupriavidus metallidurans]QWC89465.1 hypothetical protein KB891_04460 [Cupriavidus metallidurans]
MPEPKHDEALVNNYLERISALSVSAFDGADVGQELTQLMRDAKRHCSGGNLDVLTSRLRDRIDAADREDQPQVRDTFAMAVSLIQG